MLARGLTSDSLTLCMLQFITEVPDTLQRGCAGFWRMALQQQGVWASHGRKDACLASPHACSGIAHALQVRHATSAPVWAPEDDLAGQRGARCPGG